MVGQEVGQLNEESCTFPARDLAVPPDAGGSEGQVLTTAVDVTRAAGRIGRGSEVLNPPDRKVMWVQGSIPTRAHDTSFVTHGAGSATTAQRRVGFPTAAGDRGHDASRGFVDRHSPLNDVS